MKADELLPRRRIALPGAADAFGFGQRGLSGEVSPRLYTAGAGGVPDGAEAVDLEGSRLVQIDPETLQIASELDLGGVVISAVGSR